MDRPFILAPSAQGETVIIPPNAAMLEIARLYLDKYEALDPLDRELFRHVIGVFNSGGCTRFLDNTTVEQSA